MEILDSKDLAEKLKSLKLEGDEKPLLDLGFTREECMDMILINNGDYNAAGEDLLKRYNSKFSPLDIFKFAIRKIENTIVENPVVVPFLEKYFLTPEVYVGFYGLLTLFFATHIYNIDNTSFVITGYFFQKCFGLMTLFAHLSIFVQLFGMVGSTGIFPAKNTMDQMKKSSGDGELDQEEEEKEKDIWAWFYKNLDNYIWKCHTFCWFGTSDVFLYWKGIIGIVASACFTLGIFPPISMLISNLIYHSWVIIGKEFFRLQFDSLVIELGWMAVLMYPLEIYSSHLENTLAMRLEIFLVLFAVIRLHLASGACKIRSGDENWRNGLALSYHYWTTPLPNWTGWYINAYCPRIIHVLSVSAHFIIELLVVILLLIPHTRMIGFLGVFILQFGIIATGNFGSFNYFSIIAALCVLDDSYYPTFIQNWFSVHESRFVHLFLGFDNLYYGLRSLFSAEIFNFLFYFKTFVFTFTLNILASIHFGLYINLSFIQIFRFFQGPKNDNNPSELSKSITKYISKVHFDGLRVYPIDSNNYKEILLYYWGKLFHTSHSFKVLCYYGVFATMTTFRDEIIMEGWDKNEEKWKEYHLYYKPSDINVPPRWILPGHLPRLDWMLWFCSLRKDEWTREVMRAMLLNSNQALTLFRHNPFSDEPPAKVRFSLWSYTFTTKEERKESGAWWNKKYKRLYDDVYMIDEDTRMLIRLNK